MKRKFAVAAICMAAIAAVAFYWAATSGSSGPQARPSPSPVVATPAPSPSPVVTPSPAPAPAPSPKASGTYTVKVGDSLWSIAKALYSAARANACYTVLYRMNAATIEAAAKAHGHPSRVKSYGDRLYPGTILRLPNTC